jgi:hypothetical protein
MLTTDDKVYTLIVHDSQVKASKCLVSGGNDMSTLITKNKNLWNMRQNLIVDVFIYVLSLIARVT